MNIDWKLFHIQKDYLVCMAGDDSRMVEETDILDGVIHLMDAVQDRFEPAEVDEGVDSEDITKER